MAAFSYHHNHTHPSNFLLDSSSSHIPQLELEEYLTSCSSPAATATTTSASSLFPLFQYPEEDSSMVSSAALEIISTTNPQGSMEGDHKRIKSSSDGSCLTSLQPKDTEAVSKSRKQKKPMMSTGGDTDHNMRQAEGKKKKSRAADYGKKQACIQEPPEGYIHVRARRGQATDSHSLAERVRREKISERMKLLQALVPGCDKVTGKALMLDEIINYVQSLQNQVEFLSMKLASVNPMLYDFDVDFDGQMDQVEKLEGLSQEPQLLPSLHQVSPFHPRANEDMLATTYPIMDTCAPFLLHGQGPMTFSSQDNGSLLMQTDDQRQGLLNQALLNSNCSF